MLRSVKYGLYAAVLAGVVGGTVAWTNVDKTVHLLVDGRSRTVHTTDASVGQVLADAGYRAGPHDIVAPAPTAHVSDGATIVLKRGRLLHLDVDGSSRYVWTTAPTVAQALDALGYSTATFTSVSRSRRLPLGATDIAVRTPKEVTVVHDGQTTTVTTTDATVGQLIADLGLQFGAMDRVTPAATAPVSAGTRITLSRGAERTVTTSSAIPFATSRVNDASLAAGTVKVVAPGRAGLRQVTWSLVYVDGTLVGKAQVSSVVVRTPSVRVEHVGTQAAGASSGASSSGPIPSPGSAQAIARNMLKDFGWGTDQFSCLDQMWSRESGWRVDAYNPSGAYGIPQALPGSKMASAGPNWQTDAATQIRWGLGYIASRYNSPCQAWGLWQQQGWY